MRNRFACSLLLLLASVAAFAQESNVIRDILIRGNQRVSREAMLAAMKTKVGQPYLQANLDSDKESLQRLGFFQAVDVRATPVEGGVWQVSVDVAEWPEIKEFRLTGNTAVTTEEILAAVAGNLKVGDVYNENSLKPAARAIAELYAKKGFYPAEVIRFEPLKESPGTIDLAVLETKVGQVAVQGNNRTKDWVMRRLIKTRAGDVLSEVKWNYDLRRIMNTQWFESVKTLTEEPDIGVMNLTADVKETRTGIFNIGLQVDPRNTVAGVLRLQQANLGGTGQSVGLNFMQGTRGGGLSADIDYTNPFFDSRDSTLRAAVYSRVMYRFAGTLFGGSDITPTDEDRYTERRTGVSLGLSRPVNDDLSMGVSARFETVNTQDLVIKPDPDNPGQNLPYIQQDGEVGLLTFGGTLNRRDVDIDPSRGDWLSLQIEPGFARIREAGTIGAQVGSYSFVRSTFEYRRYFSDQPSRGRELDAPRRVLALRARYGVITGTVPFFEQFFAGGSENLRGYSEDRFWGNQSLLTSLEYRYPIQKALNVIAFMDYGGAWGGYSGIRDFTQEDGFKMHVGYGLGVSFRTPLGPLRLDLGFDENGKSRTHFLIGTAF